MPADLLGYFQECDSVLKQHVHAICTLSEREIGILFFSLSPPFPFMLLLQYCQTVGGAVASSVGEMWDPQIRQNYMGFE